MKKDELSWSLPSGRMEDEEREGGSREGKSREGTVKLNERKKGMNTSISPMNFTKPSKNEEKVLITSHRIQFTNEENIFRSLDFSKW